MVDVILGRRKVKFGLEEVVKWCCPGKLKVLCCELRESC